MSNKYDIQEHHNQFVNSDYTTILPLLSSVFSEVAIKMSMPLIYLIPTIKKEKHCISCIIKTLIRSTGETHDISRLVQ